jgi:hypothetical protein
MNDHTGRRHAIGSALNVVAVGGVLMVMFAWNSCVGGGYRVANRAWRNNQTDLPLKTKFEDEYDIQQHSLRCVVTGCR